MQPERLEAVPFKHPKVDKSGEKWDKVYIAFISSAPFGVAFLVWVSYNFLSCTP